MKYKKGIAVIVMTALFICAAGRPQSVSASGRRMDAEEAVEYALKKLEEAKSLHSSLNMNMDVKAFFLKTGIEMDMDMVSFQDPVKLRSDISLDMGFLGSTEFETYARELDGKYQIFFRDKNGFNCRESRENQLCRYDGRQMMKVYLEQLEEVSLNGTQNLDGKKAYQYTGVIHSDGLLKLLLDTGCTELMASLFKDSVLSAFGSFLEQEEEVEKLMRTAEDMEVLLWIDASTGYPLRCDMDITGMMRGAFKAISGKTAAKGFKAGKSLLSKMEITGTKIVVRCGEFNEAEEFEIPKAALNTLDKKTELLSGT